MLQIDVELQAPTNLKVTMSLARAYELCAKLVTQPTSGGPLQWRGHTASTMPSPIIGALQHAATTPLAPTPSAHVQRIFHATSYLQRRCELVGKLGCVIIAMKQFRHNIGGSDYSIFGLHRLTLRMMLHKTQISSPRRYHCMLWLGCVRGQATQCN